MRALYLNHSEISGGHLKLGEGEKKAYGVSSELEQNMHACGNCDAT